jgi:hypothetical protein
MDGNILKEIMHSFMHAVMITGFVFVMMMVIEYINVQTNGIWQKGISGNKIKQYIFAALLGVIPGCLGSFTAVALFSHRLISFGAIVTTMIATSGDEAFVMFAMFPGKALMLTAVLFVISVFAGYITDKLYVPKRVLAGFADRDFPLHKEEMCKCFNRNVFLKQLLSPTRQRITLFILVAFLLTGVFFGFIAGDAKTWIKVTLYLVIGFSLFIVVSVPDHFMKKHLWEHIVKKHIPRIFLWTFGTLLVMAILNNYLELNVWLKDENNLLIVMVIAVLVGIIPESGPHLVFVTLFASGQIPFSILLASSISQDGHGMLPLLAESKRGFLAVKITNIIFAFIAGLTGYFLGY